MHKLWGSKRLGVSCETDTKLNDELGVGNGRDDALQRIFDSWFGI